ncbi:MAG: hypothetical protein GOMPHAMPRED_002708 [Gomphillus americanus]|uniref:BZIP domain-containing protein n=1 Tax=Gomphillus americanus TaxID=1940652 RepID=A0A8H3ICH1_9LECA|nr:MAG: hypothetical protein GOMPHAMPRED_002708 [Gomphillus americanus]
MVASTKAEEDWKQITDPNQRRRIQNRLAQRTWRAKRQRFQAVSQDSGCMDFASFPTSGLQNLSHSALASVWQPQFLEFGDQSVAGSPYSQTQSYSPIMNLSNLWQDNSQTDTTLGEPSSVGDDESIYGNLKTRDVCSRSGNTALHEAALHDYHTVVRQLLKRGAKIDQQNSSGDTALHLAAAKGHRTVVSFLVELQPDLDLKNQEGQTALHVAAASGQDDIVELLLDHGAKIDLTRD